MPPTHLPARGEALLFWLKDASRDAENGPCRASDAENGSYRELPS